MARIVTVAVADDLDGGRADETVRFALDATTYEIDLSAQNAAGLRGLLSRYIARARPLVEPVSPTADGLADRLGAAWSASRTAVIRAWAREQGYAVSRVGRLPTEVVEAYDRAAGWPAAEVVGG